MSSKQSVVSSDEKFNFEKLEGYKKGVDFSNWIYQLTRTFPKSEQFGITSQLRRAALSIPSNIAEGAGRYNNKERIYFYRIAKVSVFECIPLLEILYSQKYINKELLILSRKKCVELVKIIIGLIKALNLTEAVVPPLQTTNY